MAIPKDFSAPHGIITDGKIGIGTQTPSTSLAIEHSSGAYASATTTTSSGISEWSTYNSDGFGTFMGVYGAGVTPNGPIGAGDSYLYSNANSLVFATDTGVIKFGTGSTLTERVQIGLDGRVGLGTSSPSMLLDVRGNSSSDTGIISKNSGIGRATVKIDAGGTSQSFLQFLQAGAEQWRFSSNGSTSFGLYDVTNSAYRMFVDSTGKMGIGTNAPAAKLDVVSTTGNVTSRTFANSSAGYAFNTIQSGDGTTSADQAFTYYLSNKTIPYSWKTGLVGSTKYTIRDETAAADRLIIDSAGNLGLGVTPSAWASSVKVIETTGGAIYSDATGIATAQNAYYDGTWKYKTTGTTAKYGVFAGAYQWFIAPSGTAGNPITFTQAMVLDVSGNLGIGLTPSGSYKLEVSGGAKLTSNLLVSGVSTGIQFNNGQQYISSDSLGTAVVIGTNSTDRMRIDPSGNVGIGTLSPSCKLDVPGGTINAGSIQFGGIGSYIIGNSAYQYLTLSTANNDRMRIDSSGNVGIGTITPTAKLEVNGNIKLGTSATINNASGYLLVQATGGELVLSAGSSSPIGFRPGGAATNQAVFDTNGNLIVGSTAQITTEKVRFEKTNAGAVSINARLSNTGTTAGTGESIVFTGFTNNAAYVNHGIIQSYATDTAGNSAMTFHTAASGITAEQARIDSLGNLGIGTTTPASKLDVSGTVSHNVVAVPALTMDLASGMYFTKTVTAPSTFTITNVPASRYVTWTLKLTNGGSSVITWPVTVKWPSGTAPVLTASGVDIITFFTDDGGVTVHGLLASKDSR